MDVSDACRLSATVEGDVQGVGYRMFVVYAARRLGVVGWVRNLANGDVDVTAEAPKEVLLELLDEMEGGAHYGSVERIRYEFSAPSGEFAQFWILETH